MYIHTDYCVQNYEFVEADSTSAAWQLQTFDLSKFNRDCDGGTITVQKWTPEVLLFPTRYGTGTADAEQSPPIFVRVKGTVAHPPNGRPFAFLP